MNRVHPPAAMATTLAALAVFPAPLSLLFCSQIPVPLSVYVSFSTSELLTFGARQVFVVIGGGVSSVLCLTRYLEACLGSYLQNPCPPPC